MVRSIIQNFSVLISLCAVTLAVTSGVLLSTSPRIAAASIALSTTSVTYRGHVVTEDGSPPPADLKLFRRVSSETTQETPVDANGEFSFQTDPDRTSVRFSMTGTGFAPFDSKWLKLNQPIELKLSRGATVRLRLKTHAQSDDLTGMASLIVPRWDEDEQGTFPVDANGVVTIAHCPLTTVKLDLFVPGFEELRIQRLIRGDVSLDVPLQAAKPNLLRVVSARDGRPIAGAKIRFFSRNRANSNLIPFRHYFEGPVWGESDEAGRVRLTTLRAIDPVPTNDPGAASYCFHIDAPGYAPLYLGGVRAGDDLGEIKLQDALEVRGEIIRDPQNLEDVSLRIRQTTLAHGGADGEGVWKTVELVPMDDKLNFHLTGLRAGPLEFLAVYSDRNQPAIPVRRRSTQSKFYGMLFGNSSGLVITRESVVPGDQKLTETRPVLDPNAGQFNQSNVPVHVILKLAGEMPETLFSWSSTSPIQHTRGFVTWRVFVLQDGTVYIPGSRNGSAGVHHKLSAAEFNDLKELLEKHSELFGKQSPQDFPEFASWNYGHETLSYTKDGQSLSFKRWYGLDEPLVLGQYNTEGPRKEIEEFVNLLVTDASFGGREARARYLEIANHVLVAAIPEASPFGETDQFYATNHTDGTREMSFRSKTETGTSVTLIDSAFGETYVERIEYQGKRVPLDGSAEQN